MQEVDNPELETETVTSFLGKNPTSTPEYAYKHLFHKHSHGIKSFIKNRKVKKLLNETNIDGEDISLEDMDAAAKFGGYKERPSDLFLKVLSDVIETLTNDPLVGTVSPPLLASTGVVPLTVISTIPDIMKHYYECIVNAKLEVLLATNYWEKSKSVDTIVSAILELDRRAGIDGRKVVVKIIIDHPNARNLINSHCKMTEKEWVEHGLPLLRDIPNLTFEMVNYHKMPLGTFHSKFMVVDRRIGLLNSNNIQDRPNLEMMSHYEGQIVNSFYDVFLISWWLPFDTPLACCNDDLKAGDGPFSFGSKDPIMMYFKKKFKEIVAKSRVRLMLHHSNESDSDINDEDEDSHGEGGNGDEYGYDWEDSKPLENFAETYHRSISTEREPKFQDIVQKVIQQNREKKASETKDNTEKIEQQHSESESHETPGDNPLSKLFNKVALKPVESPSFDPEVLESLCVDFVPFKFHSPHTPFPIVIVNRSPYPLPGHTSLAQPQNAAWLGLMKYAKRDIFIQTPTFNASPAIKAVLAACQRGIQVTIFVDYGFNDKPESSPFQGGKNATVVKSMYSTLRELGNGVENNLKVYWYTGKDQTRPFHASKKQRNCHIKFMSVDGQVAVMGNGNMDTQSWFHSQEFNVMIDSPPIIEEWMEALHKNQSTLLYGMVDTHGVWIGKKEKKK